MKIALTVDWLTTLGGAEHVVEELHKIWPSAPVFTTMWDSLRVRSLASTEVRPTYLQRWYNALHHHQPLLPWMPMAVEGWDLRGFDVIISSSHAVAKGVLPPPRALHICYCHTPMRYAWLMEEEYLADFGIRGPLRWFARRKLRELRRWDLTTSRRVDLFLANSRATQQRIARIYARTSTILHPPVQDRFFSRPLPLPVHHPAPGAPGEWLPNHSYYFAIGRLVPYKRFDLLIEAANRLRLPLRIAGEGSERRRLERLAGPTIQFLGRVKDSDLPRWYGGARALLFPTHEDAGIVPLEAQACGTPVVALGQGGAMDTVQEGVTGTFFPEQTLTSLIDAIERLESMAFDPATIRAHAQQFSSRRFQERLQQIVKEAYASRSDGYG